MSSGVREPRLRQGARGSRDEEGNGPVELLRRLARITIMTLAAGAIAPAASAQLAKIETRDLRLVYFAPSEDYLAPYATAAFRDANAFLTALFKYRPDHKITVLLADFSDNGNAGASTRAVQRAAVSDRAGEFRVRNDGGERAHEALMNHELVHIITMDQSTGRDRLFRKLFGGKVMPIDAQPESVAVLLPDVAARRRAALVHGRRRGVRGHVGERRHRPGAGRLRRDGLALHGPRRRAVLRSARSRGRGHQERLPGRGAIRTCMARGS